MHLPKTIRVRQRFPETKPLDIPSTLEHQFQCLAPKIKPGAKIAVGVGSRGISNLPTIVSEVIRQLKLLHAFPFIIPAMGSHGGATPEGQLEVLASYGITEATMGVPIHASLEVEVVGKTADGLTAYCSSVAMQADGIVLINRVKPHTDFFGSIGSGLLKMCVIGLGKRTGATAMHLAATQLGYEHAIRTIASVILDQAPILGGIAILENQAHETARLVAITHERMQSAENDLLIEAKSLMPSLPFEELDLLIVDRIGKNISGAGLDPNIINRSIHGYNSLPIRGEHTAPFIRRIYVRDLTPETHGNAIGIGMADATSSKLVRQMDTRITNINALTALTPQSAKIPITFDTDREAIERMLMSLPLSDIGQARIVRIADTLSLAEIEISEALWQEAHLGGQLIPTGHVREIQFDEDGNLPSAI